MNAAESSTLNGILLPVIVILTLLLLYYLKPRAKLNIKGKYVLITGCDSGFGRATAIALDKMGVCVLATCLTKEGEQSLNSVTSDKLKTFQLDVTNSEEIKEVRDKVNKLLVNGDAGEYPCSIFAFYCRIVDIIAVIPLIVSSFPRHSFNNFQKPNHKYTSLCRPRFLKFSLSVLFT